MAAPVEGKVTNFNTCMTNKPEITIEVESLKKEQAQKNTQVRRLEHIISNLLQDKAGLEEDKKWLEEEKNELGRRLEVALLQVSHCPGEANSRGSLQGSQEGSKWNTENVGYQEVRSELMEVSAPHLFQESSEPSHPDANVEEPGDFESWEKHQLEGGGRS
ncbi:hypothetical protein JRQ81_014943 [Phrynocephalus forsythii]|uniref:Uncharacterized protein n=1 Tax=Phrynocephalus forsythii TaxID=171643 RepID=A0A9Q0XXM2_9SAUR|nr:hypothetical protein JRQ81_014943 [Phrynocephalus forsythii]